MRWSPRFHILTAFLVGQGLNQAISLATGFLLLRILSIEDYAKFSLAFGFQVIMASLTDIGISGAIVNLVGSRGHDKRILGDYICVTRWLRNRLLLILTPIGAIAFNHFATKHGWSSSEQAILYGSLILTIYFQASSGYYAAPLIIHKRLTTYYRISAISSLSRLSIIGIVYSATPLSADMVYAITAGTTALNAILAQRAAQPLLIEDRTVSRDIKRELMHYISPIAPGVIFFAFQGQITVFLISIFGSTRSIAEVGALGRLGLLFGTLSALNGTIISPYFARMPRAK